jgi:hypothetical protein
MKQAAWIGMGIIVASALALDRTAQTMPIEIAPIEPPDRQMPVKMPVLPDISAVSGAHEAADILSRPLFRQDRRPFVPPIAAPEPEIRAEPAQEDQVARDLPLPNLVLAGVNLGPEAASALVRDSDHETTGWLRIGDQVAGWRLKAVNEAAIILERTPGDEPPGAPTTITLELHGEQTRREAGDGPW